MTLAVALAFSGALFASASVAGDEISRTGARYQTSAIQAHDSYDRFIVKFQNQNTNSRTSAARRSNALSIATARANARVVNTRELAVGGEVLELDRKLNAADAREFMASLAAQDGVEYVEVDRLNTIRLVPNDTRYSEQWDYFDPVGGLNLPSAWDISTGSGVVVAVLDTGITNHSDLNANVVAGYDFISSASVAGDGNGRDPDPTDVGDANGGYPSSWHGTHVAGTVAAVANNNKGIAGVAFNAKIQPVRVLGKGGGYDSDIADAIVWASGGSVSGVPANPTPAKVINLSLGGSGSCGSTFQNAINSAVSRGSVLVIAAGNENQNVSNASPANCNNVIAVAANDKEGNRAWYSNYGSLIDVTAPGGETCIPNAAQTGCQTSTTSKGILSTLNSGTNGPVAETYAFYDGTSMATPHVAGVAALMLSVAPSLTPAQIKTTLKNTARPLPGSCPGGCGAGIVDAYAAVTAVGGPANVPPVANFTSSVSGLTVNFTDTSTDSDGTIVSRSWNFGDGTTSSAKNPSKTYAAAGTYTVKLTVTDNQNASNSKSANVTVSSAPSGGGTLSKGVPVNGISGAAGSTQYWTIVVPAGATNLQVSMSGGTGDADLYLRRGAQPTTSSYDCRPYKVGNNESCTVASPVADTYHVMIRGYKAFSGVSLVATYDNGGGSGTVLSNNVPVTGLSGATNSTQYWTFQVPAGATNLRIETSGGTGDLDLYVRIGAKPTTSTYDCRPYRAGNNEACVASNPTPGTYHVMLRGYRAYSGVTLKGSYTP